MPYLDPIKPNKNPYSPETQKYEAAGGPAIEPREPGAPQEIITEEPPEDFGNPEEQPLSETGRNIQADMLRKREQKNAMTFEGNNAENVRESYGNLKDATANAWRNKLQNQTAKLATKAAGQLARAVGAWVVAAIGPWGAVILAISILMLVIALPAWGIWSSARRGVYGNTPMEALAYDPSDSAAIAEALAKNPGGITLPYDTKGQTISVGGNSRFGPNTSDRKDHRGIDIGLKFGTEYYSAANGVVIYLHESEDDYPGEDISKGKNGNGKGAAQNHGFGNAIVVRITSGPLTGYLYEIHHLKKGSASALGIKVGSVVNAGKPIGATGQNGLSTGSHLHFQIDLPESIGHCETYIQKNGTPCGYYTKDGPLTDHFVDPEIVLGLRKS